MEKCFSTPKTFDAILGYLERRNIFTLRTVCRKWKASLETSASLQPRFYACEIPKLPSGTAFIDNKLFHELMYRTGRAWYARHSRPDAIWEKKDASWRQLQLCSPPVSLVSVRIEYFENPRQEVRNVTCSKRLGVTLSDVWTTIMRTMSAAGRGQKGKPAELDKVVINAGSGNTCEWSVSGMD